MHPGRIERLPNISDNTKLLTMIGNRQEFQEYWKDLIKPANITHLDSIFRRKYNTQSTIDLSFFINTMPSSQHLHTLLRTTPDNKMALQLLESNANLASPQKMQQIFRVMPTHPTATSRQDTLQHHPPQNMNTIFRIFPTQPFAQQLLSSTL